ncbi:uncharacterized protein DFL_001465 [Arthrobotrys flagrans]|uniref:Uncharacterized protein n=1 Tax=Arthrobotrys flagrans TaxID=97331 RepID=A0A437A7V7_ARTFL|nr:hypothetical protein DFL_001465 [Arthrobotrys flagrans]
MHTPKDDIQYQETPSSSFVCVRHKSLSEVSHRYEAKVAKQGSQRQGTSEGRNNLVVIRIVDRRNRS